MIDQKVVGNLELGTDLEVDNLEACTESRVDKDPEEYTESWVDLGVCTVLEVVPQAVSDFLEVALQVVTNYLEVSPQAVTDYLEVEDLECYQTS